MKNVLMAVACTTLLSGAAFGQVWAEVVDAPDGPFVDQTTTGLGALTAITGQLNRPAGDHVDTYCFRITDVALFYATTKISFGGSATIGATNADSRLWLWNSAGQGLLANDDVNTASLGTDTLASFISDRTTFGANTGGEVVAPTASGVNLVAGQIYRLSISEFTNDPDGNAGTDLFNLGSDFDALHGVNPASGGAFVAWENGADTSVINYRIALRGVEFCETIPGPGALALLGLAGVAGVRRRRH